MKNNSLFAQANAYAMLHGLYFGLLGIVSVTLMRLSLTYPAADSFSTMVVLASPFVAVWLTRRFRNEVSTPQMGFSFVRAYVHSLLMGLYAGIIVALFIVVYLVWFDQGSTLDAFTAVLSRPDVIEQMKASGMEEQIAQSTGGKTMLQVIESLRDVPPANFAGAIIYLNLLVAPVISLFVAALSMKRPQRQ